MNKPVVLAPTPRRLVPNVQPAQPLLAADRVDPNVIFGFFRRRWPIMVCALLICMIIGMVLTKRQTPTFISTAEVTLDAEVQSIAPVSEEDRLNLGRSPSEIYIETQTEIIKSSHNIAAIVDRLNLAQDPRITEGTTSPEEARQAAIDYLADGVSTFRPGATLTIDISFESEDPYEAARLANAFAEQYTQGTLTDKEQGDSSALKQVGERMEAARTQASADAQTLAQYRLSKNLPSTKDSSLTEQEISAYNQQVTEARAQAAEDAARLSTARRQLGSGSSGDDVGEALGSGVISSLRQQQATYAAEIASLTSKYGPRHPELQRAQNQHDAISQKIHEEIERVISNLSAKAAVSQQRLASLNTSLNTSQSALRRDNISMVGVQDLEQRAEASKSLYESYLNRYKELSARMGIRQAEARILHPAIPSLSPASPNVMLNMALAIAVGLGLGLATSIAAEMMFKGFSTGDDIERRLGLHYLGGIPELNTVLAKKVSRDPIDAVIDFPRSAFAESFRNLRASIAFAVDTPRVIAITSALPSEGKTTVSLCLGRSMASTAGSILLIDCDIRRRGVTRWLGHSSDVGLIEVLQGTAKLEDAVVTDPRTGLAILPVSNAQSEDHDLLTGPEMDALLAKASQLYHAVILDTAPILPIADARLLLSKADASIIAARWRRTPESAIRSLIRMLPGGYSGLAGVMLTRVDVHRQAKFGTDENAFYKSYKDYYA